MMLSENVVFWPTPDFINDYGPMDPATYEHLKEQVIEGKGDITPMAGGLRSITIEVQIPGAPYPSWLVLFSVYLKYALVVFLKKYPVDKDGYILVPVNKGPSPQPLQYRKKFTTEQLKKLAKIKKAFDRAIRRRFRRNDS